MTLIEPTPSLKEMQCDDVQKHPGRRMTETEFMEWISDKTRADWVDGEVVMMAADSTDNSDFSIWLLRLVGEFIEHFELGKVLGTNVLIRLPKQRRRRMPDLLFVSKERTEIIKRTYVDGPPDLIIEIVAEESVTRDWHDKYLEYERAGVKEYWIAHREGARIEAYSLSKAGKYQRILPHEGKLASKVLHGFHLRLEWALAPKLPRIREALRELGVK